MVSMPLRQHKTHQQIDYLRGERQFLLIFCVLMIEVLVIKS